MVDTFVYLAKEKDKGELYSREIKMRLFVGKLAVRVRVLNYKIYFSMTAKITIVKTVVFPKKIFFPIL